MMCPRALRKWDDKECLIEKKKKFLLSFFYSSFRYVAYSNELHGHKSMALKLPGGMALSWLASVCTGEWPSFFVIIIYCTCHACNGMTLYLLLLRHIAPYIPLKITLHSFDFLFFTYILVWHAGDVPRRGECREALPYMTMLVVVCTY